MLLVPHFPLTQTGEQSLSILQLRWFGEVVKVGSMAGGAAEAWLSRKLVVKTTKHPSRNREKGDERIIDISYGWG
jgi:hypothetical protein